MNRQVGKLAVFLGILLLNIGLFDAVHAAAITDYGVTIDRIRIGSQISHCFCVDLWGTDIASVTITSPASAVPPNTSYALVYSVEEEQWSYDEVDSDSAIDTRFPDGTYRFDVTYTDVSMETRFVDLVRSFPPFPVLLSFDTDALTWEPWDGSPNGLAVEVNLESEGGSAHSCELLTDATSCDLPPGFVEPGSSYLIDILFLSSSSPFAFSNSVVVATLTEGPFAAGRVPDGAQLPGRQLVLGKGTGDTLTLDWGLSCLVTDTDFAVYSGQLSQFGSHTPLTCTTGRVTSLDVSVAGDRYFLVVPRNASVEGSYGTDSIGMPRQQGLSSCLPQDVGACE